MERMTGIEPAYSAWEADALPLNYIRMKYILKYSTVSGFCQGLSGNFLEPNCAFGEKCRKTWYSPPQQKFQNRSPRYLTNGANHGIINVFCEYTRSTEPCDRFPLPTGWSSAHTDRRVESRICGTSPQLIEWQHSDIL